MKAKVRRSRDLVDDLVTAAGGSISAEHGIGQLKRAELARLAPPARIHAIRAIKQALDPLGIMNPESSCLKSNSFARRAKTASWRARSTQWLNLQTQKN